MKGKRRMMRSIGYPLMLVMLGWIAGLGIGHAETDSQVCSDRVALQEETTGYLEALDNLYLEADTLYSDQGEENLCNFVKHYYQAKKLIGNLKGCLDCWKQFIEQNSNDKIYRAYAASVQLALYSIYAREKEFLTVLRFEKKLKELKDKPCMRKIYPQKELEDGFDLVSDEWEQNAESYLMRANETIKRALLIDENYKDSRILEAEWLALRGRYVEAVNKFDALEAEGWFRDQRSFPNSWKAYIAIRQKTAPEGEGEAMFSMEDEEALLRKASAFSEPIENSKWASRYMKKQRMAKTEEVAFDFADTFPVENVDLEALQTEMRSLIKAMRASLNACLDDGEGIPKTIAKGKSVADLAAERTKVLLSLSSDTSAENLRRYARIMESLYDAGKKMEDVIEKWNSLASQNQQSTDYYRSNKAASGLAFLEILSSTYPLANNASLKATLEKRQEERQENQEEKGEIIDYAAQWDEWWKKYTDSVVADIEKMVDGNPGFRPARMLQFEYAATLNEPAQAESSLENLEPQLTKYKFTTASENEEVDYRAYVAAWKSYLAFQRKDFEAAKTYLTEAKGYKGLSHWKADQEKRLSIEDKLAQKDYFK